MPAIDEFRALHRPGKPLILFNVWDAGSARAVAQEGARAIATGSYGVAGAQGFEDDESFPITEVLSNARRIITATDLPVTVDFSAGYGDSPEAAGRSVTAVAALGAVGINLEDQLPGENELNPIPAQMKRLRAAADSGLFINARCDVFLDVPAEGHDAERTAIAIDRARAYADAGGSGFFIGFTADRRAIAAICEQSPIPVNALWTPLAEGGFASHAELADLGVARISHGVRPWFAAMAWLRQAARAVHGGAAPPYDG